MRHHWARATAVLLLVLAPVMGCPQALAQEPGDSSISFSITPSRLEVRVGPGESLQFAIKVYNHSDQLLELLTYVDDVEIPANDLVEPDELAFTASRWTRFSSETFEVAAQGSGEAVVIVEVPEDTPSGGYHAVAYFQAVGPEVEQGVVALGRLGATLLLEVAPSGSTLTRDALVTETTLDVEWEGVFTPVASARVTLDNVGDLHLTAGGVHRYRVWPGQGAEEQKVGPNTVLRGTRHTFESSVRSLPLFGKVTLTSELVYQVGPDDLPVILTQAEAWIIPWRLILVILAAVGIATGLLVLSRRRRNSASAEEPAESIQEKATVESRGTKT